jgi:hypothetical protein
MKNAKTDKQGVMKPYIRRPLALQRLLLHESITINRMVMELEIECLENGGKNNGKIIHTYTDFVRNGTSRKYVKPAFTRMVAIGVVRMQPGRPGVGGYQRAHLFHLTYLPTWNGKKWVQATNEWLNPKNPLVVKRALRHVVVKRELRGLRGGARTDGKEVPVN